MTAALETTMASRAATVISVLKKVKVLWAESKVQPGFAFRASALHAVITECDDQKMDEIWDFFIMRRLTFLQENCQPKICREP